MPHQMTKHFAEGFPKRLFSQRKRILPLRNRRISADAQPVKKDTGTHLHITQRKSIKPLADRKTRKEAHEKQSAFSGKLLPAIFPGKPWSIPNKRFSAVLFVNLSEWHIHAIPKRCGVRHGHKQNLETVLNFSKKFFLAWCVRFRVCFGLFFWSFRFCSSSDSPLSSSSHKRKCLKNSSQISTR